MRNRAAVAGVAAFAASLLMVAACGDNAGSTSGSGSGGGVSGKKFVLMVGVKGDPFYISMECGAQEKARELGVSLQVQGPDKFDATLQNPLLDAVDLRGAHDFRHSLATWLEDAGIPARVIDELMGHEASTRGAQHLGSTLGAHYRHSTPEMATRVVTAIQDRLVVVVSVAEQVVEAQPTRVPGKVF